MTSDIEAVQKDQNNKRHRMVEKFLTLIGEDIELQAMLPEPSVNKVFTDPDLPLERAIDAILETYSERPALGTRDYQIVSDPDTGRKTREYLPAFKTVSYGEHRAQIHAIAAAWTKDLTLAIPVDGFVCIIGFAGVEYNALFMAAQYAQVVPVPMQSSTSGGDMDEIFSNIAPAAVAATVQDLAMAARHSVKYGKLQTLIAFDFDPEDEQDCALLKEAQQILSDAGVATRLMTFQQLIDVGRQQSWEFLPARSGDLHDHTSVILHSSGSTGKPKGAMMSEAAWKSSWDPSSDNAPIVSVNFAPLNHGMGLLGVILAMRRGSLIYFTLKPDMSTLFEDIRLVRPTTLAFFPRVLEMIHQDYQNQVAGRVKQGSSEELARNEVMSEMAKTYLGDRLVVGIVGSAPTPEVVKQFMIDCFDIHMDEGYANTETGAGRLTSNNVVDRSNVLDYKLRDVPELGYYNTDKPFPRGELCFKSRHQIRGYYKDPEANAALLDDDGYICSGDIVEERAPDYLAIIDRRKDVIKLSQAEFVAIGPLATLFEAGSALIKQIYIYGNSSRSYVLAVIVPDETAMATQFGENVNLAELKAFLHKELYRVAEQQQLKSFEVPRDFVIEFEPFSQENGLLSSVRKRLGPALKLKYGARLEALYEDHDTASRKEYDALREQDSALTVKQKLTKLLEISLSREGLSSSDMDNFRDLGGDSLGAASLSVAIEDVFGVSLAADSLLSPTGSIDTWASEVSRLLNDGGMRPSFSRIHGNSASELHAQDLRLDLFLDEATIAAAESSGPVVQDERVVLITGANGFLGRNVCLQWMERLPPSNGKVVCLIRAEDDAAARTRLDEVFRGADSTLAAHYRELSENHLEVLAGDASEPLLGLGQSTFDQLASTVDRIVHVGALVNHRLAYQHLFGPNVVGTAEVIRLASQHHKKPIDFVSTEAVLHMVDTSGELSNEDAPLLASVPLLDDHYAGGYMTSKWAAEHLLIGAHSEFGIPVNILRGNMMLAHQKYIQQINYSDAFTRLLYSLMLTGLAPSSFYQATEEAIPASSYDGMPVDVVAAAVVAAAELKHNSCRTFNMTNYHVDDGCTLDAFVNWIESAGYPVTRFDDYQEWFTRIEAKLKTLDEEQRQDSALDILGAYASPIKTSQSLKPDSLNFRELVAASSIGELPHLNEAFIHKCVKDISTRSLG